MMMCPAHGPVNGDNCSVPSCFEPLHPYFEDQTAPSRLCSATECNMPLPCPLHPVGAGDAGHREVVAHLAAASPHRAPEGQHLSTAELHFPWGVVAVPADGLTVGRDFGDECGDQIDAYDNVSRAHARVTVQAGQVLVLDLDSTNGTTINGVRIRPGEPTAAGDGDAIGFGNKLRVTIGTGKAKP